MRLTDNHIKWISDFTQIQFDNIVYKYLEEVLKISEYVDVDGSNDGGNDIRIFENGEKLKIAFQVTIQENNIDGKIKKDLQKTKRNIERYSYNSALYFFYSHPVSEEKANEFELIAQTEYGIKLYLIDAKKIAFTANRFPILLREINKQYGLDYKESSSMNENDRMLYDFYSFGSSAAEIKTQIIKSFVVHQLYELKQIESNELLSILCSHFKSPDNSLFKRVIQQLNQESRINTNGSLIFLTEGEFNRVDVMKEQFNFQEFRFKDELKKILYKFSISSEHLETIIINLRKLFESNFNADKLEVLDKIKEIDQDPVSESLLNLNRYLRSIANNNKVGYLTKDLIEVCRNNDILQKLSAGKMFTSFIDPDSIRNYLNQSERLVFLDTPIILYCLCLYANDVKHESYFYNSVKDLLNLRKENKNLKYLFYKNYLSEVAFHIKEALMIADFDNLELVESLGGSNNVFYNFYTYLRSNYLIDDNESTFSAFIFDIFKITSDDTLTNYFHQKVDTQVGACLDNLNVSIFENSIPKELFEMSYNIFENCLIDKERVRGHDTIKNDSYMISTLFQSNLSVNEPIFVTWDLVFFNARKKYNEAIPASRLWHWFTPDRLNNHLSLLNFNLNADTITRDLLTVFDEKFNFYKKTQTLLDTISKVINIKTQVGKKYVNAINEFKTDYIYEVNSTPQSEPKIVEEKKAYPIEDIMFDLVRYYHKNTNGYSLEDFRKIFQDEALFSDVINYFKDQLLYYKLNKAKSEHTIIKMDEIIKKAKSIS